MIKSQALIEKIKKTESPPQLLKNFFSKEDILKMISWYEESKKVDEFNSYRLEDRGSRKNDITSIPQNQLKLKVIDFLATKVEPIINHHKNYNIVYEIAFHSNKKAYGIHTDSGYDQEEFIYKQGIIPLRVDPEGKKTHTVLMDQKCYFSSSFPLISKDLEAQKQIELLNFNERIDPVTYNRYWKNTAQRKEQMFGFTICHPFEWVVGDTIIWDRSHVHCSSDFEATGVKEKLGLMWISKIV